jgi:hypothetical protein
VKETRPLKDKHYMFSLTGRNEEGGLIKVESRIMVTRGWEECREGDGERMGSEHRVQLEKRNNF